MFYASNQKGAVFDELGLKVGDCVHIMAFALKPEQSLRVSFIGEYLNVHQKGVSLFSNQIGDQVSELLNSQSYNVGRSLLLMDAFFASVLRDPDAETKGYGHSQALAQNLFRFTDAI